MDKENALVVFQDKKIRRVWQDNNTETLFRLIQSIPPPIIMEHFIALLSIEEKRI